MRHFLRTYCFIFRIKCLDLFLNKVVEKKRERLSLGLLNVILKQKAESGKTKMDPVQYKQRLG